MSLCGLDSIDGGGSHGGRDRWRDDGGGGKSI
jgi:hypothetical protein